MNELPPPSAFRYPDRAPEPVRFEASDRRYPHELQDLSAPPSGLWTRGSLDLLAVAPRVAIVGTRRATAYGLQVARELAAAFARAGACVVSGLAAGVDGAAHRAVIEAAGTTIGILGTGIDQVFPKAHRELHARIAATGLLLTELQPGEHGTRWTFPERNRIIAALCRLTIVVEAGAQSGALGTAEWALLLGRDVAAVPGPIDQPQSAGTNRLLADGAHVLTTVEDALALAGLTPVPRAPAGGPLGDDGRVWTALAHGSLDIDSLCHQSGLPAALCLAAVTRLELAGSIECALTGAIRRR